MSPDWERDITAMHAMHAYTPFIPNHAIYQASQLASNSPGKIKPINNNLVKDGRKSQLKPCPPPPTSPLLYHGYYFILLNSICYDRILVKKFGPESLLNVDAMRVSFGSSRINMILPWLITTDHWWFDVTIMLPLILPSVFFNSLLFWLLLLYVCPMDPSRLPWLG